RQARVGAHRPAVAGRDVPVGEHLGEHEAREPVRLAIAGAHDPLAVIRRDVDGRARHELARGVLDELGGDRACHAPPQAGRANALAMIEENRSSSSRATASATARALPGRSWAGSRVQSSMYASESCMPSCMATESISIWNRSLSGTVNVSSSSRASTLA